MALDLSAPEKIILKPLITVLGVGGAGGNAVNNMISSNLQGAKFVVANTDAQALANSLCESRIQLGAKSTKGLGAGASPDVGREAAEESENEIRSYLEGSNMVFVTAGMGGGTGTGGAPVIAKIARELGILTVGVVTKPFLFEGARRMKLAESGLIELQKHVHTLIIIPNQNLFSIANENTTFEDAFKMADEVLHAGVRSVTDLSTMPGLINLDFADIKAVMSEMGKAMMGTGEADGADRAIKAAEMAIANPLLDHSSMKGAKGVLINITGGRDMTLYEVDSAANRIREEVGDPDANIIFGSTFNPDMKGIIRVSVVATGIDVSSTNAKDNNLSYNNNKENSSSAFHNEQNMREEFSSPAPSFDEYSDMDSAANNHNLEASNNNYQFQTPDGFHDSSLAGNMEAITQTGPLFEEIEHKMGFSTPTPSLSSPPKQKSSFLKRMWNSLKSSDNIVENYQENHNLAANRDKSLQGNTFTNHQVMNNQIDNRNFNNSVHETPNMIRRK